MLPPKFNKLAITPTDLCYIVTKTHIINEESTNTVKQNTLRYPHHIITPCNFNILYNKHYVDGRIILRWIFRKLEGVVGTGWSWLRIGTGGEHFWVRRGNFGFHKCGEFLD